MAFHRRYHLAALLALPAVLVTTYGGLPAQAAPGTPGSTTSSLGPIELGPPPVVCQVQVPFAVTATSPTTAVTPTFTNCSGKTAAWDISHASSDVHVTYATFRVNNGVSAGPWKYHDPYPTGTYDVSSQSGTGNQTSFVVKFGSRISLKAGPRNGTKFLLSGIVSRYSPSANAFQRWANRRVAIYYKDCATCAWKYLASNRTGKHGYFDLTAISSKVRYYQARVLGNASVWGRVSVPVRQ